MRISKFLFITLLSIFHLSSLQAQVVINEFSAANIAIITDNYGSYEDVIELYNTTAAPVPLAGWYLSDRSDEPTKWSFPAGTTIAANGFLRIWASGRDEVSGGNIHTNFKITQTKGNEGIILSDPAGIPIDVNEIDVPNKKNHSWGRVTNGAAEWGVLTTPTIGTNNVNVKKSYALKPEINPPGGGYSGPIEVTMTTAEPNSTIRYTLNGNVPTGASTLYTGPITVTGTTVVRATTFSSDTQVPSSFVESNTYFVNVTHTVKIVSIYDAGVADLLDGNYDATPEGGFEMYSPTFERLDESVGEFDKHGNDSWAYDQRGFDYVVEDELGYDYAVHDPIFDNTDRDDFQHLIVKAAANDNYPFQTGAHIRDAYLHRLSQNAHLELDERTYEPCVVYLNGQYWGLYELREKVDESDYTKHYYDKDGDEIDFIKTWGATWTEYGDMNQWAALRNYITFNNMATPANYAYVESKFNLLSLIDYIILNTHAVCMDWLNYNTGWWHSHDDQVKWRYILWDLDASFGHYVNYTGIPDESPTAQPCDNQSPAISDPEGHTEMLTALLENPNFRETYINRYADLNNTYLSCDYMIALLDSMITRIEPEMPRQVARWGGTVAGWQSQVQELRDFILDRCVAIEDGIVDCYDVQPFNIVVKVEPPLSGTASINNIIYTNDTWAGLYYSDINLNMLATPSAGYLFDHWEMIDGVPPIDIYAENIIASISVPDTIIAHFTTPQTLTILADPVLGGTIAVNGVPVTLPYTQTAPIGTGFALTATPNAGYEFVNWTSDIHTFSPDPTADFVWFSLVGTDVIVAHFAEPQPPLPLTVEVSPTGGGNVSINGITPTAYPYSTEYNYNTEINAIATPQTGYTFSHWELANHALADPNIATTTFTITQTDVLRAVFVPIELQLTLMADPQEGGTILFNGTVINSFPHIATVTYNDLINLTAQPNTSYSLVNWTAENENLTSPNNPNQSFALTQTDVLTAHFSQNTVTVTITIEGAEGGTVTLNGTPISTSPYVVNVVQGTPLVLNAASLEGYEFGGWTISGATGIDLNNPNITINADGSLNINLSFDTIILVNPEEQCGPARPTAFSPNGDGVNDGFRLLTHCAIRNYTLRIFDRWGNLQFMTNDPAESWNGKFKGHDGNMGVYVWTADYDIQDNGEWKTHTDKGNITLIR